MLPNNFKPKKLYDLIRVGKNNDGGYLVGPKSILDSQCLISFGINNDWSFEKSFKKIKNVPVLAYDPSISFSFWRKNLWFSLGLFFFGNFKSFYTSVKNIFDFRNFFDNKNNFFFQKKIGQGGYKGYEYISIKDIIKMIKGGSNNDLKLGFGPNIHISRPYFFKMDIESSEYRILDDLINMNNDISGIVVEFHNVDLHLDKISNFIEKINLDLIHIHANNMEETDKNNIPTLLELTFEKNPVELSDQLKFPHELDQKNDPSLKETYFDFIKI